VLGVKVFSMVNVTLLLDRINLALVYGEKVADLSDNESIDCNDVAEAKNELDMIERVDSRAMIIAMAVIAVSILLL
jgi:hypothetical protein